MRIIIVEDEIHNYRLLHGMIEEIRPDWQFVGHFEGVAETVEWLNKNEAPDLIFMDIQLTDGNCFSIFEKTEVESLVIFTTAYDEYAIQAFDVNSVDYLLKPIKEEKLEKAILKFEQLHKLLEKQDEKPDYSVLLEVLKGEKKYRKRFLVAGAMSYSKIDVKDIAYFYTESRVTFAVDFEKKEHILDLTLEKLEEQLDPDQFFRANRSEIINSESVHSFENHFGGKLIVKLEVPFDKTVKVSRLKAAAFKQWLDS